MLRAVGGASGQRVIRTGDAVPVACTAGCTRGDVYAVVGCDDCGDDHLFAVCACRMYGYPAKPPYDVEFNRHLVECDGAYIDALNEANLDADRLEDRNRAREILPMPLVKALEDPFQYAVGLRDGRIIEFSEARLVGDFVHLIEDTNDRTPLRTPVAGLPMPRGVWVRIDHIAWAADAPRGS